MTKGLDEASTKFFDSLMLHSHGIKPGEKTTITRTAMKKGKNILKIIFFTPALQS